MVKLVELEDMTRTELLALAKARGVELPAGYVSHDQLVELLRQAAIERKREARSGVTRS
jgi:hypothetical protein